jgi:hypothetical protein
MSPQNPPEEIEVVIPVRKANTYSFALFLLTTIVLGIPFGFLIGFSSYLSAWKSFLTHYPQLVLALVSGVVAHEFLHAVTWSLFAKNGWKSITFGIHWKELAPFVHCDEFLPKIHYIAGVAMPGLILGVLPLLISCATREAWLFCFGSFFTAGAGGDFLSLQKLASFRRSDAILDHPKHLGFLVRKGAAS